MQVCFTCIKFTLCCNCAHGECDETRSHIENCWEEHEKDCWNGGREFTPAQLKQLKLKEEECLSKKN